MEEGVREGFFHAWIRLAYLKVLRRMGVCGKRGGNHVVDGVGRGLAWPCAMAC